MSSMQLMDPFETFEDMLKSMWRPVRLEMAAPAPAIRLEVSETDDAFKVKAQVPGVKKDDIKVKIDHGMVSISAETKQHKEEKKDGKVIKSEFQYGAASRSFTLDNEVDADKAEAKYEDGVLFLTLPKKQGTNATTLAVK
jgi:HSP20 family protein